MSCIIETYYGQFAACILLPISTNSLCYGSNTLGVHIAHGKKEVQNVITSLANQINLKLHMVSQACDNQELNVELPYNVEVHEYQQNEGKIMYVLHMVNKLWVRYAADIYLRPEVMTTYSCNELEPGFEKFTWKEPEKCNECIRYIQDYEYYSYDKYAYGDRKTIIMKYRCCLVCYERLFPSRNFKVPFNKIVRKSLPMSLRLTHWRNVLTDEVVFKPPNKKIPLNPDSFDSLNEVDAYHEKDKKALIDLFYSIRNDFVDDLITELNRNQDYMLFDSEHLAKLAHSKGINMRFLGKVVYQANFAYIRQIAITMIIARSIKRLVLNALNSIKDDDDPKDIMITYLNQLLSVSETAVSRALWDQLTEYIREHWDIVVERGVLMKLHMPSLTIAVCKQLRVNFLRFFEINYLSLSPFPMASLQMFPIVLDSPYVAKSLDLLLSKARTLDKRAKKSQWNMKSGQERERATEYFDKAVRVAIAIYGKDSIQYADTALEYASHLESMHEESGNPLNSKWNRASKIPSSKYSESAIYYFSDCLNVYESEGLQYKKMIDCMLGLSRLVEVTDVILYYI